MIKTAGMPWQFLRQIGEYRQYIDTQIYFSLMNKQVSGPAKLAIIGGSAVYLLLIVDLVTRKDCHLTLAEVSGSKMQTTSLSDTRKIWPALSIFLLVFALCLLGIVSRPGSFLAIFWPANAVLLAVLVRRPQWATHTGWGMAVLGYLAADLLTGSALEKALLLNAANLAGVVVGYLLFMRLSPPARMLQRGASSMYLFGICLAAAAATGLVGAVASQWLFGRPYLTSLGAVVLI